MNTVEKISNDFSLKRSLIYFFCSLLALMPLAFLNEMGNISKIAFLMFELWLQWIFINGAFGWRVINLDSRRKILVVKSGLLAMLSRQEYPLHEFKFIAVKYEHLDVTSAVDNIEVEKSNIFSVKITLEGRVSVELYEFRLAIGDKVEERKVELFLDVVFRKFKSLGFSLPIKTHK